MLQRTGLETDKFASPTGTMRGLDFVGAGSMQSGSKQCRSCRGDEAFTARSRFVPPPHVGVYILMHRSTKTARQRI